MFVTFGIAAIGLLLCWRCYSLTKNYVIARKIGLPIIITPVDWQDPLWLGLSPFFAWIQWLPFGLGNFYSHSTIEGVMYNKYGVHSKIGAAYIVVSPNVVDVVIGDSDAAEEVIRDWKIWRRPQTLYDIFNTMGKGVASSDGEEWSRHRKIVSHGFKESTNKVVWEVARQQAQQWLDNDIHEQSLAELSEATIQTSMNVMMHAIFGQKHDFHDHDLANPPPGYTRGFSTALNYMIKYIMLDLMATMLALPTWLKLGPFKELDVMRSNLFKHFAERLVKRDGDLIKTMVEANEAEKNGTSRKFLTDQEMYGNMFIINLAGFETTSYAMLFTLANLAQHPEYQDWARSAAESYEESWSSVRLRALFYETVRIHTVLPALTRYSDETRILKIDGKDYSIPAGVWCSSNFSAVHYNPQVWGDDADEWKPDRWVEIINHEEHLRQDLLDKFVGWSTGPRFCPGRKFSQVEGSVVINEVLLKHRLEAGPGLRDALKNSGWNVTPKFRKPECASIRFHKREQK